MHLDLLDLVFLHRKHSEKTSSPPAPDMADQKPGAEPATCPVDHKTRDAWLAHAKAQQQQQQQQQQAQASSSSSGVVAAATAAAAASEFHSTTSARTPSSIQPSPAASRTWTSSILSYLPFASSPQPKIEAPKQEALGVRKLPGLGTDREVSSIPRSSAPGPSSCPVNHEQETGADATTGNWIYPSEKMFFDAMKRKGYSAEETDMRSVVPIHNAVNERAWKEIKEWEAPYTGDGKCATGPRLHSFAGDSTRMSPRARINTLLGYAAPFDRHDWVVDRCGTTVEYVIDFYQGRAAASGEGKPSFYLDVRPKLNSWEGVRMRASRFLGIV